MSYKTSDDIKKLIDFIENSKQNTSNVISEEEKISKVIDAMDMRKYTISPPGQYLALSILQPHEAYNQRFLMMSLNLFMHELINEISDPHHPRYMPENEINIVKKFISNVFAFNPKMDTTSFVTKQPDEPCFDDYVKYKSYLEQQLKIDQSFDYKSYLKEQIQYRKELFEVINDQLTVKVGIQQLPIPSMDSLANWQQYIKCNFERLREVMKILDFNDFSLESAVQVHGFFDNLQDANTFLQKHNKFPVKIDIGRIGLWSYTTPHEDNLITLDVLGDDTKILRDIIESNNKDKEMLPDILKNRVKNVKNQNLKEEGIDEGYTKQFYDALQAGDIPVTIYDKSKIYTLQKDQSNVQNYGQNEEKKEEEQKQIEC